MEQPAQHMMRAIALDSFGGPETLVLRTLPMAEIESDEVLIRVEVAGVGQWDPFEREGGYAKIQANEPHFPYVLGSEGAIRHRAYTMIGFLKSRIYVVRTVAHSLYNI
jgi:NADPH:quinone reductase